ncbi:MAG TPA: DivIVA domain-containing protein [Stackebrandtia sp.]|jgi:DivIVA domain-containing protein|uniref:DivIVA domain-containing protein n=1 Tax=Stackebrandtia sp. TaxID=2023065 RepID=UPI002D44C837|nr:DivIVA domain-containing protein [Stackebrandtia sp.]HZE40180.1 DivIVA domain-containing protein [Stackebrandtia sp.]
MTYPTPSAGGPEARAALLEVCARPAAQRFRRAPFGKRGYKMEEVDQFVDRVKRNLDTWLTTQDAQDVRFGQQGWRGYDEGAVDDWIDRVGAYVKLNGR